MSAARNAIAGGFFWPDRNKTGEFTKVLEVELCHCILCWFGGHELWETANQPRNKEREKDKPKAKKVTPRMSQTDKCKVLHLDRNSHGAQYRLWLVWLVSRLAARDPGGPWWATSWIWVSSVLLQQQRQIRSWAASAGELLAEIELWSSHCTERLSGHIWSTVSSSSPHSSRKVQTDESRSKAGQPRWSKGWRTCPMRKDWRSFWVFSHWRRGGSAGISPQYSSTLRVITKRLEALCSYSGSYLANSGNFLLRT